MAQNAIEMALQLQDNLSSGLARASSALTDFNGKLDAFKTFAATPQTALAGIAVGVGLVAAAATKAAMDLADYAEQLDNLSASSSVSAKNLQTLQFAFKQGGVDAQALTQGLQFLNRAIEANDPALGMLGVTSRDTFTAFMQAAEGISTTTDATLRAKLAFDVFGRGGAQLIPILQQISSDFDGLASAAVRSGVALSSNQLQSLKDLDTAADKLGATLQGLTNVFAVSLAPAITMVADNLDRVVNALRSIENVGTAPGNAIGKMLAKIAEGLFTMNGLTVVQGPRDGSANTGDGTGGFGVELGPGNAAGIAVAQRASFFSNTLNQTFGTDGDKLGLRGGGRGKIGILGGLADEVKPVLDEAGKRFEEFAAKVEDAFGRIGDSVYRGFYSVLSNLTNKTQTFASAMKTIWNSLIQGVLDAMAHLIASAITKAFLRLLGLAIAAVTGNPGFAAAGNFMSGAASVSPGSIPGTGADVAFRAGSSGGGGGNTYVIQSINMKDGISAITGVRGSLRDANTRIAEVAAVS